MTVDHRMESFVAAFGNVPPGARRLDDAEARDHWATWIRRLLGKGIACQYVIAYQQGELWWTFCFERELDRELPVEDDELPIDDDDELWTVEAYDSAGHSWRHTFRFDPHLSAWGRVPDMTRLPSPSTKRASRTGRHR
jgi:hypothetical protein